MKLKLDTASTELDQLKKDNLETSVHRDDLQFELDCLKAEAARRAEMDQ